MAEQSTSQHEQRPEFGIWMDWKALIAMAVAVAGFAGWLTNMSSTMGRLAGTTELRLQRAEDGLVDHESRIRLLENHGSQARAKDGGAIK